MDTVPAFKQLIEGSLDNKYIRLISSSAKFYEENETERLRRFF